MPKIQFAAFGVGAVGGYFGAALARAGYSVAFIARGAHLDAIRRCGLHIRSPGGDFKIAPALVTDNPADVGPVDAVILGVKAWQVPEAANAMRPLIATPTKLLPLQNGVEAADQLRQVLGQQHPWSVSAGSSAPSPRLATSATSEWSRRSCSASWVDRLYQ